MQDNRERGGSRTSEWGTRFHVIELSRNILAPIDPVTHNRIKDTGLCIRLGILAQPFYVCDFGKVTLLRGNSFICKMGIVLPTS